MTTKTLAGKLAEVMHLVAYVQKDGHNSFHRYKYASAEKVYQKVNAELSARNIAVSSSCELLHQGFREAKNGDVVMDAIVKVSLTLVDGDSAEQLTISGLGQGSDKGDKATMKAVTAATKYALSTGFLISWGDDPEQDVEVDKAASTVDFAHIVSLGKAIDSEAQYKSWLKKVRSVLSQLTPEQTATLTELKESSPYFTTSANRKKDKQ